MKVKLLRKIVAHIKAHPEHWKQSAWHCGTSHCVAGFAELDAAGYSLSSRVFDDKLDGFRWKWKLPKRMAWIANTRYWKFLEDRRATGQSIMTCDIGREHLELTDEEARWLFDPCRRLEHLSKVARTGKFPEYIYSGK